MTKNSTVDFINKQILKHGTNMYGDPTFRVVFSDDQKEVRYGTFERYSEGGIYLGEYTGEMQVPKYLAIKSKWILERWAAPEISYHKDVKTARNGDYICVYIYQDRDRNYLPPLLKVAEIIIHHLLHPRDPNKAKIEDEYAEMREKEKDENDIFEKIKTRYEKEAKEAEQILVGYVKEKTDEPKI